MANILLERTVPLPLDEAWRRITEWRRHGEGVPLTRVGPVPSEPTRVGTLVVARSGVGPLSFDDPMEVTVWEPPEDGAPGMCRLEKRGSVVLGWAELEVRPGPGGRTRVVWREEIRIRLLPSLFDGVVRRSARYVFGRALKPPAETGVTGAGHACVRNFRPRQTTGCRRPWRHAQLRSGVRARLGRRPAPRWPVARRCPDGRVP
ncbi:hypothetical protein GCM10011428_03910 [Streptomyces violaceus]